MHSIDLLSKRLRLVLLGLAALALLGAPACIAATGESEDEAPALDGDADLAVETEAVTSAEAANEWDLFDRHNDARARHGLRRLRMAKRLRGVARDWAAHMAARDRLFHNPNLVNQISVFSPHWQRIGENVGVGTTIAGLQRAFMDSEEHRRNILGDYKYVGVGVTRAGTALWVTVDFLKTTDALVVVTPP